MVSKLRFVPFVLVLSLLLLPGCRRAAGQPTPEPQLSPLSPETHSPLALSSPVEPLPTEASQYRFALNQPLVAGATSVNGTGLPGQPIIIADVTLMGERLGAGVIEEDGTFAIDVEPPLIVGRLIGIRPAVVEGTTVTPDYLQQLLPYKGEGAREVPQIGLFLDTATVEPGS